MSELRFRLVNVFALDGDRFSGNPLCVFEDARGLSDAQMQSIARQFNLSETTFVLPSEKAVARVRIFTPTFEMPFAGHPTLGTAAVVRELRGAGASLSLEMKVGVVEVSARGDQWTLKAAQAPSVRAPEATRDELGAMLGLDGGALADRPLWVDTGAEQLVIPLAGADEVRRARPDAALLARHAFSARRGAAMAYVWAHEDAERIVARFFFDSHGSVIEDPATGSACANLGGWWLHEGRPLPALRTISQGDAVGRPSRLELRIDERRDIFVTGLVHAVGAGQLSL